MFLQKSLKSVETFNCSDKNILYGLLIQLDRMPDYESGCCRFESYGVHQQNETTVTA